MDIEVWAESYIRLQEDGAMLDESHPDYLAASEFYDELIGERAEECWQGILAVLRRNPPEHVVGMLAAGPVEDLINQSGDEFIDRIEVEARRDPLFRYALHQIYESGSFEVWKRILRARGD